MYRTGPLYRASNLSAPDFSGAQRALNFNANYLNGLHQDIVDSDTRDKEDAQRMVQNVLAQKKEDRAAESARQQGILFGQGQEDRTTKLNQNDALAKVLRNKVIDGVTLSTDKGSLYNNLLTNDGKISNDTEANTLLKAYNDKVASTEKNTQGLGVEGLKYILKNQRQARLDEQNRLNQEKLDARNTRTDEISRYKFNKLKEEDAKNAKNEQAGHDVLSEIYSAPSVRKKITDQQYKTMIGQIDGLNKPIKDKLIKYNNTYNKLSTSIAEIDKKLNDNNYNPGKDKFYQMKSNLEKISAHDPKNEIRIKSLLDNKEKIIKDINDNTKKDLLKERANKIAEQKIIDKNIVDTSKKIYGMPNQDNTMIPMTPKEIRDRDLKIIRGNKKLEDWKKAELKAQINKAYDDKVSASKDASRKEEKFQSDLKNTDADTLYKIKKANSYDGASTKGKGSIDSVADSLKLNTSDAKKFKKFIQDNDIDPNKARQMIRQIRRNKKYDNFAVNAFSDNALFGYMLDDYQDIIDEEKKKKAKNSINNRYN